MLHCLRVIKCDTRRTWSFPWTFREQFCGDLTGTVRFKLTLTKGTEIPYCCQIDCKTPSTTKERGEKLPQDAVCLNCMCHVCAVERTWHQTLSRIWSPPAYQMLPLMLSLELSSQSRACLHAPVFNHNWYYLLPFLKVLCEQGHVRFLPSNWWEASKCLCHLTTIPEKKPNPVDISIYTFTWWSSLGGYGDAPNTGKGSQGKQVSRGWPWTLSQVSYMIFQEGRQLWENCSRLHVVLSLDCQLPTNNVLLINYESLAFGLSLSHLLL